MGLDSYNDIINIALAIPSLGVVIAYGFSMIRRRISADMRLVTEDKSYSDMLDVYKTERDEIRESRDRLIERLSVVESERNQAVNKVSTITSEIEFLSQQVTELKELVETLGSNLDLARKEIHSLAVDNAKLTAQVSYLENNKNKLPPF